MPARITRESWIERAKEIWGNTYEYPEEITIYRGSNKPISFICEKHGNVTIAAATKHVNRRSDNAKYSGCPDCEEQYRNDTNNKTVEFIERAREIWGDTYEYPEGITIYTKYDNPINIKCLKHGIVTVNISGTHINIQETGKAYGCHECGKENSKQTQFKKKELETFLEQSRATHSDNYDYSLFVYKGDGEKSDIICNTCGETFPQAPGKHIQGSGCPYCKKSKGEKAIKRLLDKLEIDYEEQKRFDKSLQRFDFYIPGPGEIYI
jgi:protein-arginine kinase activator protein McsA